MPDKDKCFIIMPITTPENFLTTYRDGPEHFKHVLDCLFVPAVEKAGFVPVPPIAKGSDLIHAEVIRNLETSEIVLCDMSTLNPNVFFEFGIRTSLNKPVCVVKDELTSQVPFDTAILNYQEYNSSLDAWTLPIDIQNISKHINTSLERSKGENTLWKYFGFRAEAIPPQGEMDTDSKLEYILNQLDNLNSRIGQEVTRRSDQLSGKSDRDSLINDELITLFQDYPEAKVVYSNRSFNRLEVFYSGDIPAEYLYKVSRYIYEKYDRDVIFTNLP